VLAEVTGRAGVKGAAGAGMQTETRQLVSLVEAAGDPTELRNELVRYWALVARMDTDSRRRSLESLKSSLRWSGERGARTLKLFALGDADAAIVYQAVRTYLQSIRGAAIQHRFADAIEWLSRRLAIRSDAVFAALLAHGNVAIDAQLLAQRHTTTSARMRELFALLRIDVEPRTDAFLREWNALETMEVT
jgi:hypothetical protein